MYSTICDPKIMKTLLPGGFPADKLSQPEYEMTSEFDVYVTMRDGVKIAMDIHRPDAPGKFPVLFMSTGYMKALSFLPNVPTIHCVETNDIEWFVQRGYIVAIQDQRGTGKSVDGEWDYIGQEMQYDLYDCIEWLAVQPWSTGKVGMIGESLLAHVQWFAAATQPPHLVTIVPYDGGADLYRDIAYHGGNLSVGFPSAWHLVEIRANYNLGMGIKEPKLGSWDMPRAMIDHPTFDDFWKIRRADFSKIKCPLYSIGFWHKTGLHLRGNTRGYEEVDAPKKMLLCHGEFEGDEMAIYNSPEMRLLILRWLDHWLKGNDTGVMEEPPVTLFVHGLEEYREEQEWPLKRADYTPFYLSGENTGVVDSLNDGKLVLGKEPTADNASVTYSYPQPDWSHFSGIGAAVVEHGRVYPYKKVLTFTTDPMENDLEVCGHARLILYASTDQEFPDYVDTKFYVKVWDQLPDDVQLKGHPLDSVLLTHGRLRASHSFEHDKELERPWRPYYTHENPQELENNKIYKYDIEILPFANIFRKGHRIRIEVACHDTNMFDFGGHHYGLNIGKDTIYFDKKHPSKLILPVTISPSKT